MRNKRFTELEEQEIIDKAMKSAEKMYANVKF